MNEYLEKTLADLHDAQYGTPWERIKINDSVTVGQRRGIVASLCPVAPSIWVHVRFGNNPKSECTDIRDIKCVD